MTGGNEMNCSDIQPRLSAYFDGELTGEDRDRVARHLQSCAACSGQVEAFGHLSQAAHALPEPSSSVADWEDLASRLDGREVSPPVAKPSSARVTSKWWLAAAALIFLSAGIGFWKLGRTGEPARATAATQFHDYLATFRRDPARAQSLLLTKFEGRPVPVETAARLAGYRPAAAAGLPDDYAVESTYVMKMPCCTCVQTVCRRRDGSTLAIFEHGDTGELLPPAQSPSAGVKCCGADCCLAQVDDRLAVTRRRGARHITLVGVKDPAEANHLLAWMDRKSATQK